MRKLGLQTSLTCEGVLQSARSIENTLRSSQAPTSIGVVRSSFSAGDAAGSLDSHETSITRKAATDAREAALERSKHLLRFVDHNADQLLLSSEESGRWFVDPPPLPALPPAGGGGLRGTEQGMRGSADDRDELLVGSGSGSEGEYSDDGDEFDPSDDEDEEERAHRLERERAQSMERRERERAREALAALRPPPNAFVEELNGIAWLPVHARAINELMPWQVLYGGLFCTSAP